MEFTTDILLNKDNLKKILQTNKYDQFLKDRAQETALSSYGNKIFVKGQIKFTNHCKNDCYYCRLMKSNTNIERYRLNTDEILDCYKKANKLGIKSFLLQGGDDGFYSNAKIVEIIKAIKSNFPQTSLTLSIGERSYAAYKSFYDAGADSYLLRHKSCTLDHYTKLHPEEMSLFTRLNCLKNIKLIGFQTGCGIMVGSPYQTIDNIADDILYMYDFNPELIEIRPFISQKDTIFQYQPSGSIDMTLRVIAIMRILLPTTLILTTLNTFNKNIREKAILSGANVLIHNISHQYYIKKHNSHNKSENLKHLKNHISDIGYILV